MILKESVMTSGIHHVTAVASDPQRNLDFYAGFLGLRLVKRTVNFDDPTTYHLYYGDTSGQPGTILTFFPWPGAQCGQRGTGQFASVALSIPQASLGFWLDRLSARNLRFDTEERFGKRVLAFDDPDGLRLELVADEDASATAPWRESPLPAEHAVRGIFGVTLWEDRLGVTSSLLTEHLGFREDAQEGFVHRYVAGEGPGRVVDIRVAEDFWPGILGAGTVHHVAFRSEDDAAQLELRQVLAKGGLAPTPQVDRQYFRSVYFREPGGALFEVATDPPGFTVDEPIDELGGVLKLPPQYEGMRGRLEAVLPPLHLPTSVQAEKRATFEGPQLGFIHRWLPKEGADETLLLLHGTGGDENDLVPLGQTLHPDANLLSPRGKVLERGSTRFFRRLEEGVFDEDDVKRRADELATFVVQAASAYDFSADSVAAVGYSNGANIASAAMLRHPGLFRAVVLFRPMIPLDPGTLENQLPDLSGVAVFLGAGRRDPLIPTENALRLATILQKAGAEVTLH